MSDVVSDLPGFTDAPSTQESDKLTKLGCELYDTDSLINYLEEELKEAKAHKLKLTMKDLPAYMETIGQDRVGLAVYGVDIVVEDYYHANIAADWDEEKRQKAFRWLEKNGHGDLIKAELTALFPRTLLELARWIRAKIYKLKLPKKFREVVLPEIVIKETVPWNTLTSFVKEQVEKGEKLPLETLGATVGKVAKIKPRRN